MAALSRFAAMSAFEQRRPPLSSRDFRPNGRGLGRLGRFGDETDYTDSEYDTTDEPSTLDTISSILQAAAPAAIGIAGSLTGHATAGAMPGTYYATPPQLTQPYNPGLLPPAPTSNTMLYVGLGVAALAAVVLMKKK